MSNHLLKTGVLLLNLGTPDHYDARSVRRYLKVFLNDPRVVDLPAWIRWPLVNLFIIPFRTRRSVKAYQSIWQDSGSPLMLNSLSLQKALAQRLGESYRVVLGMRYGNPSVADALEKLKGCQRLLIFPLFPQYASAATGSVLERALVDISNWKSIPEIVIYRTWYQNASFIRAYADLLKNAINGQHIELVLFSYHGLPQRQVPVEQCLSSCDQQQPCPVVGGETLECYRAQCYVTSKALASHCGLPEKAYLTVFQSRLGRTPWIQPYADEMLPNLIQQGVKRVAVVCPSFVSDCLETLEEIGIKMKAQWEALGGEVFILVPCLNDDPAWVEGLAECVMKSWRDCL